VFKKVQGKAGTLEHGAVWMASNHNPALHNLLKIAMDRSSVSAACTRNVKLRDDANYQD